MPERSRPDREKGHLVVAAVRLLSHRDSHPPRPEEVAELIGEAPEATRVVVRQLVELGVLREVADAYRTRLEVGDYLKLEELEAGGGAAIQEELQSFTARRRAKQEELKKQFAEDLAASRRRKFSELEEDLRKFRGREGPRTNLWGEPIEESEEES